MEEGRDIAAVGEGGSSSIEAMGKFIADTLLDESLDASLGVLSGIASEILAAKSYNKCMQSCIVAYLTSLREFLPH